MIDVSFKTFCRTENEVGYKLKYNGERYYIFAPHDGEFHNELYECEREIPAQLEPFVSTMIREDLYGDF